MNRGGTPGECTPRLRQARYGVLSKIEAYLSGQQEFRTSGVTSGKANGEVNHIVPRDEKIIRSPGIFVHYAWS